MVVFFLNGYISFGKYTIVPKGFFGLEYQNILQAAGGVVYFNKVEVYGNKRMR